jgi:hypothetical protein
MNGELILWKLYWRIQQPRWQVQTLDELVSNQNLLVNVIVIYMFLPDCYCF